MTNYFFDASPLVKRYHTEAGTVGVDRILSEPSSRFFIARLTVVEVQSGLARKVRMRELQVEHFELARQKLLVDISQRRLSVVRMTDVHFRRAEQLITQYGTQVGQLRLRTLDALQLAVALAVHQHKPLDFFVAAEDDLNAVAQAEQLSPLNPMKSES
jgi:predicted nucleic acid-binding protein